MASTFSTSFALQVAPFLANVLVASLWQGLALVLLTACAFRLLPDPGAAWRSALWAGVLVLAGVLPLALPLSSTPGAAAHPALWHARSALSTPLIAVWLLAGAFRLAQLAASFVHLQRVLRRAEPLVLTPVVAAVLKAGDQAVRVCASPDVSRPSVAGFLRPCILLPPGLVDEVSEAELRHILLHEREHLRRRDQWINLLGQISLVLFPLSPAFVWMNRRLASERELACDDRVLQSTGARKAYAACLARVAERSLAHRGLALAIGILGARRRGPELVRRVERILAPPVPAAGSLQSRLAVGALCAGLLGGAVVLAHSPEPVSFLPLPEPLVVATAQPASAVPAVKQASSMGQVVPVVDRVSGCTRVFGARALKAVLPQAAPARTPRRVSLRIVSSGASTPARMLTAWHRGGTAKVRTRFSERRQPSAGASLRVVPVMFRVSSPEPGGDGAWYTAFRTPDGWVVVMI